MLWGRIPRGNGGRVAAVLLVDNAAQPMQAAPVAALKGIAVSGNASKLHVIFTHFDQVKGGICRASATASSTSWRRQRTC